MNEQRAPLFISWTLVLATNLLETLGLGAVAYIVAYIYSTVDSDDDRFIAQKVFKSLPHAFLRMWVTQLWVVLVMLLLYVFSFTMAGILYAIMSVAAGWSDPPVILLTSLILLPVLAGSIFLVIMFAFAQFIAVLEPENYGREALKRSTKMARAGRAGTIVAVFLIIITCSGVLMSPAQAIATGTLPLWEESTLIAFIGILNSVFGVYFGVVSVVMYFVYKSRFDAVSSSIPVFKRSMSTDSAENPSNPLIPGADHSKSVSLRIWNCCYGCILT